MYRSFLFLAVSVRATVAIYLWCNYRNDSWVPVGFAALAAIAVSAGFLLRHIHIHRHRGSVQF